MKPSDFLKNGKVYVWKERFAVIKSKKPCPNAFANITDKNEITVIIDETKYKEEDVIVIEKGWKLLTFDMTMPFVLTGFMAAVSKAMADANIPIFVISAYSTDHVFVKETDLKKAKSQLEKLGCIVKEQ